MNMLSFTLKTNRGPDFSHKHRLNTSGGSFVYAEAFDLLIPVKKVSLP